MCTEVRGQCMGRIELQSGYCGNDKFVADRKESVCHGWSLLGFTEFREGRDRLLYAVWFRTTAVEPTIPRSDVTAFDMSTKAAVIALENRLPSDTFGTYITFGRQ